MRRRCGHAHPPPLVALATLVARAAPADAATRNFGVSGFDRIRVDGPFRVRLATGVAPFASATAARRGARRRRDRGPGPDAGRPRQPQSSWGGYPGEATGPGRDQHRHARTDRRLAQRLGQPGDRQVARPVVRPRRSRARARRSIAAVDGRPVQGRRSPAPAARSLAGTALKLTATVRGVSTLDATGLRAKDATIGAEGPATVERDGHRTRAKVDAQGAVDGRADRQPGLHRQGQRLGERQRLPLG